MAFYPLLLLAFVSVVYFVTCVNGLNKPQVPLVGDFHKIDVNSKIIKELVNDIQNRFDELAEHEIVEVISAKGQVVAGLKYILTVQTRPKHTHGPPTQECTLTIWDRPWLQSRTLLDKKCALTGQYKHMAGGWTKMEITDYVRKAAKFGMSDINMHTLTNVRLITKIKKVETQIVAGSMFKIYVTITDTNCANNVFNIDKDLKDCPSDPNGITKDCEMTVLSQPWKDPVFKLIKHTCN